MLLALYQIELNARGLVQFVNRTQSPAGLTESHVGVYTWHGVSSQLILAHSYLIDG